ncbi:hypothetical protein MASR1M45_25230 [Candidatus Kapaibacterium sp.]
MKKVFIISIIALLHLFNQSFSKDIFSYMKRTIDEYEFESDSVKCSLQFDVRWDKMKIDLSVENKFSKMKYQYSGKSKLFIHALNSGEEVFIDAITNDTLILNEYLFYNRKGKFEFAIGINALSKKAFIFNVENQKLLKVGNIGMLKKVLKDTTPINCNDVKKYITKTYPIRYSSDLNNYDKSKDFILYFVNDTHLVYNDLSNNSDFPNEGCLKLSTEIENSKLIHKIYTNENIGAKIPESVNQYANFETNHYYKYQSEEVNIYIHITYYSLLIVENLKTKKMYYYDIVGLFTY